MATPQVSIIPEMQQAPQPSDRAYWTLLASSAALSIAGSFVGDQLISPCVRRHLDPEQPSLLDALGELHRRCCIMIGRPWMEAQTFDAAKTWLEAYTGATLQ